MNNEFITKVEQSLNYTDFACDTLYKIQDYSSWAESVLYGFKGGSKQELKEYIEKQEKVRDEWVDSQVDIYYNKLYSSCSDFADYVEEAREQGLFSGNEELWKQLQIGQYEAYRQIDNIFYQKTLDLLNS